MSERKLNPRGRRLVYEALMHAAKLPTGFSAWLEPNLHVYDAFEREALNVGTRRAHYSARTIIEFLRHHTLLAEAGDGWKLDNDMAPGLARLFALVHPQHAHLFEFRERRVATADRAAA